MEKDIAKNFLKETALKYDISISEFELEKFYLYMMNLLEWNNKINLTAIKDEKEIIIKHFIDSIIINKYIIGKKIIDIGSGAGFPGIPLKIINEDLDMLLVDSVNKKVNFMKDSIDKLGLKNIEAIHVRAEELAHEAEYRERFDIVTSRAVANMSTLVEYMLPFLKVGGKCLCLKGPNSREEIEEARGAILKLGGNIGEIIEYSLEENDRCLVVIHKLKNTEQTYPRKQGKPLKEPLR